MTYDILPSLNPEQHDIVPILNPELHGIVPILNPELQRFVSTLHPSWLVITLCDFYCERIASFLLTLLAAGRVQSLHFRYHTANGAASPLEMTR